MWQFTRNSISSDVTRKSRVGGQKGPVGGRRLSMPTPGSGISWPQFYPVGGRHPPMRFQVTPLLFGKTGGMRRNLMGSLILDSDRKLLDIVKYRNGHSTYKNTAVFQHFPKSNNFRQYPVGFSGSDRILLGSFVLGLIWLLMIFTALFFFDHEFNQWNLL